MNTIDTSSEVNDTREVLRRAFGLSRRARDLLLFCLLCGDEPEASDPRGAGKRWRELTGGTWHATRGGEAVAELAEAGFAIPPLLWSFLGPIRGAKANQIVKTTGARLHASARVTSGVVSRAPEDLSPSARSSFKTRSRLRAPRSLRSLRALCLSQDRLALRIAKKNIKTRKKTADFALFKRGLSEVTVFGVTYWNKKGNDTVRSDSAVRSDSVALSEVTASPAPETKQKKNKRPRDPLLAIADEGKVVDVDAIGQLVDDAFFGKTPPPSAGSNDEAPGEEDAPEAGQQVLPEFAAEVGEESTAPATDWKKLATKLVVFWGARAGRPRVRVTPKRARMVKQRLKEGYTQDDLHRAIAGVCYSPFHRDNGHDTIEVAIRSGEQVEKGIRLWFLYAPAKFIAGYEQRTGKVVPERAEEVAKYYRKQASLARATEREKQDEERAKQGKPPSPRTAAELFAAAAERLQKKQEEQQDEKLRINIIHNIEQLTEFGEFELIEQEKARLKEVEKRIEQKAKKAMSND